MQSKAIKKVENLKCFYILLIKSNIIKKKQINNNVTLLKFKMSNNEKNKRKKICDSAIQAKKS